MAEPGVLVPEELFVSQGRSFGLFDSDGRLAEKPFRSSDRM